MIGAVTNHLWQSTLFVLAAALVAAALRQNGAHVRHRIWLIASLKFLVPFSLLLSLGAFLPTFTPATTGMTTTVAPSLSIAVDQIAEPFRAAVSPVIATTATRPATNWTPTILAGIWACGFVVIVLMRFRNWHRVRAAMRASAPMRLATPVPVRSSPGLLEPGVVGLFRPVLLVPAGIEQQLTAPQLEAVLAHELCHVQRRDNLTSAIHMVVEATFWFHPLVWWIGARLVDERERACDEHVLRVCGEPQVYAESILSVCKLYVESPIACVSGVGGADLRKRVAAILVNRVGLRLNPARRIALVIAAVLALLLPLAAGMLIAPLRALAEAPASAVDLASAGRQGAKPDAAPQNDTRPRFDVVSVKPCDPNAPPAASSAGRSASAGTATPGRLRVDCTSLYVLMTTAYQMFAGGRVNPPGTYPMFDPDIRQPGNVPNVPDWVRRDRYTVEAMTERTPPPSVAVMEGPMLQTLLEDRFMLKIHRATRDVPMFELVVGKGGAKVTPFKVGTCVPWDTTVSPQPTLQPGQRRCENIAAEKDADGNWVQIAEAMTLDSVAWGLGNGRGPQRSSVVNKTGIPGYVSFRLVYGNGVSYEDAFKNQLGLELRPTKGSRDFLVVDHVERPTPDTPSPIAPFSRGFGVAGSAPTRAKGAAK